MADETKVFPVGRLRKPAGRIRLESDGSEHDVLHVKSKTYHALRTAKGAAVIPSIFEAAAALVPSMTAEQAGELTLDDANDIIAIAGLGVEAVEAMYPPNAESPATSTSPG